MLYHAYQAHADWLHPMQAAAGAGAAWLRWLPGAGSAGPLAAAWEVLSRLKLTHRRPAFGISTVQRGARLVPVSEQTVQRTPFASLLHFATDDPPPPDAPPRPRVLVLAPLSGHFATLLGDTVRTLMADHEVYITDWHNARDVPLSHGRFGLAEYVGHVIGFLEHLGPGAHLLAVCQPCVPALAAVARMASLDHAAQPRTMTLIAGPIDCRVNPTQVNHLATSKPIEWFERHLISRVPLRHAGAWRRVYPGFLQLAAFMSMNPDRHRQAFTRMYEQLAGGDAEAAAPAAAFYEEYFAVNDLAAEFYLETVAEVFQRHALATGELVIDGERIDPSRIRRTALFTVEGERDDICAIGQTVAAHDLCSGIRPYMKTHHVQLGVGHYGAFSGRRWQQQIYPRVRELIYSHD
jgi:poly(3-hydroxybutyrate) depolymerase